MLIKTFRHEDDWLHPDEVVTYNRNKQLVSPIEQSAEFHAAKTLLPVTSIGSFTCDVGDKLLVAFSAVEKTSGGKLCDPDDANNNQSPDGTIKQLHLSLHQMQLGDSTNNQFIGYNSGFEHRCQIAFFDRETHANARHCTSLQDLSAPYDGSVFGGINNLTADGLSTGVDANLGSFPVDLVIRNMSEIGTVRIIKWTGANAPDSTTIETAMEWMWYQWAVNNNPILYPPLRNYTN